MGDVVMHVQGKQQEHNKKAHLADEILSEFRPESVEKMKEEGWTVLHCAVFEGREEVVARILSVAPEMTNAKAKDGSTALSLAVKEHQENVVIRLLELCPDLIDERSAAVFLFHEAIREGLDAVVAYLLAVKPSLIHARGLGKKTPLHIAAEKGHVAMATRLLAAKPALLDAIDDNDWTAMHWAASEGQLAMVEYLLTANPKLINPISYDGSALHCAASKGHLSVVKQLLAANPALINQVTDMNLTALHCAASKGHLSVVEYLLAVDPTLSNALAQKYTALHYAASGGYLSVVEYLLAANPKLIDEISFDGTALHCAASEGHLPVVEHLLAARPGSIRATTAAGWTVLHCAAAGGHKPVIECILAANPELIDAVDCRNGWTALHCGVIGPDAKYLRNEVDRVEFRFATDAALSKSIARALLAVKPDLTLSTDKIDNNILHFLAQECRSKELIEEVWNFCPEALRAVNDEKETPFEIAATAQNDVAIELFQWSLTWEEIVHDYTRGINFYPREENSPAVGLQERFRPAMELQCASLHVVLLPDVVGTVFEYLGFERAKKTSLPLIPTKKKNGKRS